MIQTKRPIRSGTIRAGCLALPLLNFGCAPTIDILGAYFPAWLVSAIVGLLSAYAVVVWLGRRPGQRELAQSGILFCSLTVIGSLLTWWAFFRDF